MMAARFLQRSSLHRLVERFAGVRVAVVGDFFLDRYLIIDPELSEPSLETGLPAHQVVEIRNSPGAAGTVVNNLAALGAGALFAVGIVGDDAYGYELRRELLARNVDVSGLAADRRRCTPTYTKPMVREAGGERERERLDVINRTATPADLEAAVVARCSALAKSVDALIVLDQVTQRNCGVVTDTVRRQLVELARLHPRTLFYADSRAVIREFTAMTIKVNQYEALRATGGIGADEPPLERVRAAGAELRARTGKPVFVTMGSRGILCVANEPVLVPGIPVSGPVDVTGAGDSATAAIVLALGSGADHPTAAALGNLVASITIRQLGTTGVATPAQVLQRYEELET